MPVEKSRGSIQRTHIEISQSYLSPVSRRPKQVWILLNHLLWQDISSRALRSGMKEALPPQLATKSISLTSGSIRPLYLGWQVGGSNVLPPLDCVVLGAPPVPPHHVEWVLAAAAGAGGLAPEFPFLPVPSKNRDDKDAEARFVRQCVWGGGERLCRHRPPFPGHVVPSPQSPPHMPLLLTASLCWASCCLESSSSENMVRTL